MVVVDIVAAIIICITTRKWHCKLALNHILIWHSIHEVVQQLPGPGVKNKSNRIVEMKSFGTFR